MIPIAIAIASASFTAFAVMVASIRRAERRHSLFGAGDAFTRKVLALHTEHPDAQSRRPAVTASGRKARR